MKTKMSLISQNLSASGSLKPKRSRDNRQWKKTEREKEMQELEDALLLGNSVYSSKSTQFFDNGSPDSDSQQLLRREPAWVDEAEATTQVDISMVSRLRKLRKSNDEDVIPGAEYVARLRAQKKKLDSGTTHWAEVRSYPVAEDDEELVARDRHENLELSRLRDANREERSNSVITSVQFHPIYEQLMFTAGPECGMKLFQMDGKRNPKVDSFSLDGFPIRKASFTRDGSEIIMTGRRKSFYVYDLVRNCFNRVGPLNGRDERSLETFEVLPDSETVAFVGDEGYILLVSSRTKQLIGTLKMNGTLCSLAFAENGTQLLSGGGDGNVYHWDIGTRKCMHIGPDEGSLGVTSLSVSPDSTLFCTGSSTGIVNLYDRAKFLSGETNPLKTFKNLTTEVNEMKFSPNQQCLVMRSEQQRDAVRLVHVPSCSVIANWPRHNLGHVSCLDFSMNGKYLAAGNAEGYAPLWEVNYGA